MTWIISHINALIEKKKKKKHLNKQLVILAHCEKQLQNLPHENEQIVKYKQIIEYDKLQIEKKEEILKINENLLKQAIKDKLHSRDFIEMTQISIYVNKLKDEIDILKMKYKNTLKSYEFYMKRLQDERKQIEENVIATQESIKNLDSDLKLKSK